MPKIFISYRRADSSWPSGRIYDRMAQEFGKDNIFKDVDNIPYGSDFRKVLAEAVGQCDVVLAIIGKQWATVEDPENNRRLDDSNDFVRIEIESGLNRDDCVVIPVLVDGAEMPKAEQLPGDLGQLIFRNAANVRNDPDFHRDVNRLVIDLQQRYDESDASETTMPSALPPTAKFDVNAAIGDFYKAFSAQDWGTARALLNRIRESGLAPYFDADEQEKAIEKASQEAQAEAHYNTIRIMVQHDTPERVWETLQVFWQNYPNYDPDNLGEKVRPTPQENEIASTPVAPPVIEKETTWDVVLVDAGRDKNRDVMAIVRRFLHSGLLEAKKAVENTPTTVLERVNSAVAEEARSRLESAGATVEIKRSAQPDIIGSIDILPEPFAWITPPNRGYSIAKYPTTNGQYAKFIEAGGYSERKWWTAEGWQHRQKENWTEPLYWANEKFNGIAQPVVGVSWFESVAFCLWLSDISGEDIMLPTERTWQISAQGGSARVFPWGNSWDDSRANADNKIRGTTHVKQYEGLGDSPFGVVDMVGNVYEWCLTDPENKTNLKEANDYDGHAEKRVTLGGNWLLGIIYAQIKTSIGMRPTLRSNTHGFRLYRSDIFV